MEGEPTSLEPLLQNILLKLTQYCAQDSFDIRDGELIFRSIKKELLDPCVLHKCMSFRGRLDYHEVIDGNISALLDLIKLVNQSITVTLPCIKAEKPCLRSLHNTVIATLELLRTAYQLCKDTLESKDDAVKRLSATLNVLFRHGFMLQSSLVALIDQLLQSDADDSPSSICGSISEGLCSLADLVQCLDPRALLSIWKTIARLAALSRSVSGSLGDFHLLLSTLCSNIDNQTKQCFAVRQNSERESAEFSNAVKLAAFMAKVLVNLLALPVPDLDSGTAEALCLFLLRFHEHMMRAGSLSPHEASELNSRLFFVSDLVVEKLVENEEFSAAVFRMKPDLMPTSLAYLLCKIFFFFASSEDANTGQLWVRPSQNIFDRLFECLSHCTKEIRCRRNTFQTNFSAASDIYSFALLSSSMSLCGLNAKIFKVAERSICSAALGHRNALCRQFGADLWCFMARYGNAELCLAHLNLLADLTSSASARLTRRAARLFARFCPLARESHQSELLAARPFASQPRLWRALRLERLSPAAGHLAAKQVKDALAEQLVRLGSEAPVTLGPSDLDLLTSALRIGRSAKVPLETDALVTLADRAADLQVRFEGDSSCRSAGERLLSATCRLLTARLLPSNIHALLPALERICEGRPSSASLALVRAVLDVQRGCAPESFLSALVRGLACLEPRVVFVSSLTASHLAKSAADDRIFRQLAANPLARSRFEQLSCMTEVLSCEELGLLMDVLPQFSEEAERPPRSRKRVRSPEAENHEEILTRLEAAISELENLRQPLPDATSQRLSASVTRLQRLCNK